MKRCVILISALLAASVILNLVLILGGPKDTGLEPATQAEKPAKVEVPTLEQQADLATQVMAVRLEKQSRAELNLLRKLATEEGAVKTTREIDKLFKTRAERTDRVLQRMRKARPRAPRGERAADLARRRMEIEERMKERRLRRMRAESPNDVSSAE